MNRKKAEKEEEENVNSHLEQLQNLPRKKSTSPRTKKPSAAKNLFDDEDENVNSHMEQLQNLPRKKSTK